MAYGSERRAAIAVDIGGTTTRVAVIHPPLPRVGAHQPIGVWQLVASFPTEQRYTAQLARLGEAVAAAADMAQQQTPGRPAGVGISLGGRIARDGSGVSVAPNLRDYEGRPLVQDMSAACDRLPVRLAHDAVCGLLAERRMGALMGAERCAYLTLSTGTGCAVHLEAPPGSPGSGAGMTLSIELGHQLLDQNERVCLCGQTGCLETYTGGRQLALRAGQPIETLPDTQLADLWRALVEKLSIGLVNLAQLTRVELVAVGGAIALNHPALLDALRAEVADRLRGAQLELVTAALGEQAPLLGAAALLTTPSSDVIH